MQPLLDVRNIMFDYVSGYSLLNVLDNISFKAYKGDFISIVGPSGCGKSTLLNIICGLEEPTGGEIEFDGRKLSGKDARIGYMLQKDQLLEWRTVYRNVMLGPEIEKTKKRNRKKACDMLLKYGLKAFETVKPSELSGGMKQRAALIRTLIMEPDLMLLDEPFSALDYQTRLTACNDICRIIRSESRTAVMVTHDLAEAISTGTRVLIMTNRPSSIKEEIVFDEEFSKKMPLERRNDPGFNHYFKKLWEAFSYE